MSSAPIFVGGLMKSGTTLLRALISNHSQIFGGLETHWFAPHFQFDDPHSNSIQRLFQFFDLPADEHTRLYQTGDTAEAFIGRFMDHCTAAAGKQRWVEKTPGNVNHLDRIFAAWPEARFLHVIRDPRDVYASWKKNNKYDLDTFLDHIKSIETRLGDRLGGADAHYHEVHYEDLVRAPEEVMRGVMTFLDAPWEDAVAVNNKGQEEYTKVRNVTGKVSTTLESLSKPIFTGSIDAWREQLTDAEVARILSEAAGYIAKSRCMAPKEEHA